MYIFLSEDGFYVTDGNSSKPIGNGKVDRFFQGDLKRDLRERVRASVDQENKLVCWSYPSRTGLTASTQNDKILVFHYETGRWSVVEIDHELMFQNLSEGKTLEQLDDFPASGTNNIEQISVSFDDAGFSGGLTSFGVFNTSHFLGQFNGNTLACELGTGETEIFPQSRSLLTHVRPIIDTDNATGSISFRNRVSDTASNSGQTSMHSTGTIPFHRSARYFKINIQVPASTTWSDAQGLDIEAIKEGYR